MKKGIIIFTLLILIGILLYPGVNAAYNFTYKIDKTNKGVIITGIKTVKQRAKNVLIIPKRVFLRRVTAIDFRLGDGAPRTFNRLEMPDTVTRIGQSSFFMRDDLEEIQFSNNLKTIEKKAFRACYDLKEIELPASLEWLGEKAFENCWEMKKIVILGSKTKIERDAFRGCEKLESMFLADGITEIGDRVISGSDSLAYLRIPASITDMTWFETSYMHRGVPDTLVIVTPKGSVAEQYALEHGIEVRNE